MISNILTSLGVDWTLFVHLICFGISYFFFTTFILKPYAAAMHEREKRTQGNEDLAVQIIEEANRLQDQYEQKAKAVNAEIKSFFDASRAKASQQYDELVTKARAETAAFTNQAQAQVSEQIKIAKDAVAQEIPTVSAAIASKLAGKEISL